MNSPSRLTQLLGFRLSFLFAVSLLPLGVISTLQARTLMSEARARSELALLGATRAAAAQEVSAIERAQGAAQALAQAVVELDRDPVACSTMMKNLVTESRLFSFIGYWKVDGQMDCSSAGGPRRLERTPAMQAVIDNRVPTIRVSKAGQFSGTSILFAQHPVFAPDGTLLGFTSVSIPHAALAAEAPIDSAASPIELVTFNRDGVVITASQGLDTADASLPAGVDLADYVGSDARSFTGEARNGETRAFSVVPLIPNELYAFGSWASDTLPPPISLTALPPWTVPLLMWLLSLGVALVAAERLVARHIRKLKIALTSFASGNRAVTQLNLSDAPDEIRKAGIAFEIMTDAILRDEADLEDMIHQKEVLMREVHHRVKNNLQLIASIMNLQARRARSPEAKVIVQRLQERVMSLATIHKGLYMTTGVADVQANELLDDIVRQIMNIAARPDRPIDLTTDLVPLRLTPDQAVPLALLVSEAVTNAIKYGSGEIGRRGKLSVSLRLIEPDQAELQVVNAVCPHTVRPSEPGSEGTGLGSQLVDSFAMQLGGSLDRQSDDREYRVSVRFTVNPLVKAEERRAMDPVSEGRAVTSGQPAAAQ